MTLAVIGGTGFGAFAGLAEVQDHRIETPYGSAEVQTGKLNGRSLIFLPRHGMPARKLPHLINYRANLKALEKLGATQVLAVTAVGTVDPALLVPSLVVPNQLIDYTHGRDLSFFEDEIHHIDFTEPYDPGLRLGILRAVNQVTGDYPDLVVAREGVYGCTQGPRLETAAEIRRLFRDGCTIVGMTAMPEAALAREMGMPYAGISVTVNPGPGLAPGEVVLEDIEAAMDQGLAWVKAILLEFMAAAA